VKPTQEQEAILAAFEAGEDIRVQAGAGSGKTSTMVMLAKSDIEKMGTYLAYNKAIQTDAAGKFPYNTTTVTSHAMAYRAVGHKFKHRLNGPRLKTAETAGILGLRRTETIGEHPPLGPYPLTRIAQDVIRKFTQSADSQIGFHHMVEIPGYGASDMAELTAIILPAARRGWADLSREDGRLWFGHDHYFKIWALTNPKISDDFLMLDESQDTNPALLGIVQDQTHLQRVSVGDSAQSIYAWRGATDAHKDLPGRELTLSQSFRFGPAIADEANMWLDMIDAPIRLTGFDPIQSRVSSFLPEAGTVLCRTNGGVMGEAMKALEDGHKVAIVGGDKQISDLARACLELQEGQKTIHPELIAFNSWAEVQEFTEEHDGRDLKPMVDLIDRYTAKTVLYATNRFVDEENADRIVSTAHKAKGREWDSVRIGEDFRQTPDEETGVIELDRSEAMLCYVAVTRAQKELGASALDWLKYEKVVIV
jgi:UvrD/REP helicase N-terminal domain/UvrD-like helicase C-terminal domain